MALSLWVAAIATLAPLAALAQGSPPDGDAPPGPWLGDLSVFSANALVGGIAAGVIRHLGGGDFRDGFVWGATGGALAYVGKRIAVERFDGAGLLGRQTAAIGGSLARNAAMGLGPLDTLVVPLGPVKLYLVPGSLGASRPRLDLEETFVLTGAVISRRLDFDWGRSLSAGAPVFRTDAEIRFDDTSWSGSAVGGLILLSEREEARMERTFGHERVHIIQRDFLKTSVGLPLEQWGARWLGISGAPILDRVDVGLGYLPYHYLLSGPWSRENDVLEVEAEFLEGR